jgi:MFS family permease
MANFKSVWRNSTIKRLFNLKTDEARGRSCMLASSVLSSIVANITGGIFYSGYLVEYGITIINIGILTFIPFIATGFSLLSPMILERIKKRRVILAASRAASYIIKILGMILLPILVKSESGRNIGFAVIVFTASAINSLFASGYSVWHINFLPESIRADYFNISSAIANFIVGMVTLLSAIITDTLAQSEQRIQIITALYIVGFVLAMLDVFVLCLPKEYEYEHSSEAKPKLTDTIRLAFSQKKFILTMWIMFGYTFASNLTASVINVYLLEDIGVSYTFVTGINASYFVFFVLFGAMAKRMISKYAWFKTFAYAVFPLFFTYILYSFVDHGNYRWLMLIVRLTQHFLSVMIQITYSNFPYINLPPGDRTNYLSFYTVFVNLASLLSMLLGTGFVGWFGDSHITLLGRQLGSIQILMLCTGTLLALLAVTVLKLIPKITPDKE